MARKAKASGLLILVGFALLAVTLMVRFGDDRGPPAPEDRSTRFDRTVLAAEVTEAGFSVGDPVFIRILKREAQLEVWMQPGGQGRFQKFRTYPICKFSGDLGPKLREGDKQSPEGFYRVAASQLNPQSRHHLSFNLAFPNAFDQQLNRTGSALMVQGGCTSVGCYAMTDRLVDEIYALVEAALVAGQDAVDIHALPFGMSADALQAASGSVWHGFWSNLAQGDALFRATGLPPAVAACNGRYRFGEDAGGPGCEAITGWV